jgi:hypothetical protein
VESLPGLTAYIFIFDNDELTQAVTLFFYGEQPPEAATYQIGSELSGDMQGKVLANFVDRTATAVFDQSQEGSVTLEKQENAYNSHLKFSALNARLGKDEQALL